MSVDTMGKWMAHHLAESMRRAETESDPVQKLAAEKHCVELILRLWENRYSLPPDIRPLGRLEAVLKALSQLAGESSLFSRVRQRAEEAESPWLRFAADVKAIEASLAKVAFLTATLEADLGTERRWLAGAGEHMAEQERQLIALLDHLLGSVSLPDLSGRRTSIGALAAAERTDVVMRFIENSLAEISTAVADLKSTLSEDSTDGPVDD